VFWSDLASAHCTKDTLVRLAELKIKYVPKDENPPNASQIRPIENFWANLKRKVYNNNYSPKDINCLMAKIRKVLKSIETTEIHKAMKKLPHSCNFTCKIAAFITGNSVLCFHNKKFTNNQENYKHTLHCQINFSIIFKFNFNLESAIKGL
jgi:hypothetical protein